MLPPHSQGQDQQTGKLGNAHLFPVIQHTHMGSRREFSGFFFLNPREVSVITV